MTSYAVFKLIHILAVVVFLGNIFTGLFWMYQAHKTHRITIIHHTIKSIILSDRFFTVPGVIIIVLGGLGAAIQSDIPLLRTGWIFWSIILFSVSGIVYGWKLAPLQKKIYRLTAVKIEDEPGFDWAAYQRLFKAWDAWGLLSILTPLLALVMMVFKWPAGSIFKGFF
jgi:uncharacterized membrane protein